MRELVRYPPANQYSVNMTIKKNILMKQAFIAISILTD